MSCDDCDVDCKKLLLSMIVVICSIAVGIAVAVKSYTYGHTMLENNSEWAWMFAPGLICLCWLWGFIAFVIVGGFCFEYLDT